jgi:hypothetical protein
MTSRPNPGRRANPLQALLNIEKMRHERIETSGLDPKAALLRRWQSSRLARTYEDLLAHPRYAPACRFFLDDLYGPRDFSQRDYDLTRMYEFARTFVPDSLISPLARTVELHFMTQALDARLLDVLMNRLGVTDTITSALYAEGYRVCDNYTDRAKQIDMIVEIGELLDRLVRIPLIGTAVVVARGPAKRAGWVELTDFLERGYNAFKHMKGATFFLSAVRQREMRILDKIFANDPDPFGFSME